MKKDRIPYFCVLMLLIAVLACNAPTPGNSGIPTETADAVATAELPTQSPTSADCPAAGADTTAYVNEAGGYCFVYPSIFDLSENGYDVTLSGQPEDPTAIEFIVASLNVNVIAAPGVAGDVTAASFADERALSAGIPDLPREDGTIAGIPAVIIETLPGLATVKESYLVTNQTLYSISAMPSGAEGTPLGDQVDSLWQTVTGSIVFFPVPAANVRTPDQVCPTASAGTTLYIDREQGYCLLYPSTFEVDAEFRGSIAGGPEVSGLPDFVSEKRSNMGIGDAGPMGDRTLEDVVEQYGVNSVPGQFTTERSTVGGYPAIIVRDFSPPVADWTAFVNADGELYTILVQPTDFAVSPEAEGPVNELWTAVTGSIQFFTPWR